MMQYLVEMKVRVGAIAIAGPPLDPKEIILYTLNGLPPSYHVFKTSIVTSLQPITLDDLYSLSFVPLR